MIRLITGFALAALWFPITVYIMGEFIFTDSNGANAFSISLVFTTPPTLFLAVPAFYMYSKKHEVTLLACTIFGLLFSTLMLLLYSLVTNVLAAINIAPIFVAVGVTSSSLFWAIGVFKNAAVCSHKENSNA